MTAVHETTEGPQYGHGYYRNRTPFYLLPGQGDYDRLPARARSIYAMLVAAGCGAWSEEHLEITFRRTDVTSQNFDPFPWPTPVAAFLQQAAWLPVVRPLSGGESAFERLGEVWHFSSNVPGGGDYAMPDYAPLLAGVVRQVLDRHPESRVRLQNLGLNVWNDPRSAAHLVRHVGRLVNEDGIAEQHAAPLCRAYDQAWSDALAAGSGPEAAQSEYIVVTRRGKVGVFDTSADDEMLYISDGLSRLAETLLGLTPRALLDVSEAGAVGEVLGERLGERVIMASEERVVILANGDEIVPDATAPLLLDDGLEWLAELIMVVLELKSSVTARLGERDRAHVLGLLRSCRVRFVDDFSLRIGTHTLAPPPQMREAVPLPDDDDPTLVVRGGSSLTWRQLEGLLPALADLLSRSDIASELQLAVKRLSDQGGTPRDAPQLEELADALEEQEADVRAVVRDVRGSASVVLEVLAPAIVALAGLETYERLAAEGTLESEADALRALRKLELDMPAEQLRSMVFLGHDTDELRRELGIPLADYNQALLALNRTPISYAAEQASAVAEYVGLHYEESMLGLRRGFLTAFRAERDLSAYVTARDDLLSLSPDEEWALQLEMPTADQMAALLSDWLCRAVAGRASAGEALEPVDVVRRNNRAMLHGTLERVQRTLLAWALGRDTVAPQSGAARQWSSPSGTACSGTARSSHWSG